MTLGIAQIVKCLSIVRETWVRSLGREDPLERSRGRVRDSALISHQKHIKTTTTCRVTLAAIGLWTKRAALLQPKK